MGLGRFAEDYFFVVRFDSIISTPLSSDELALAPINDITITASV